MPTLLSISSTRWESTAMSADWSLAFGGLMAIIVGCNVSSRQFRAEGELHSTMIPGRTYIAQTPERPVTLRAAAEPRILWGMGRAMLVVLVLGSLAVSYTHLRAHE